MSLLRCTTQPLHRQPGIVHPSMPIRISTAQRVLRTRLAQRWVAMAEQRLRDGDIPGATAARDAARGLDAKVEGLADLGERLRAAASAER